MPTLVELNVENELLVDGPHYGHSPRWTYYLFADKVYRYGKKKPRRVSRKTFITLTGDTRAEMAAQIEAVLAQPGCSLKPGSDKEQK